MDQFKGFKENFKKYKDSATYDEMESQPIEFDVKQIQLENFRNMNEIMHEMNQIATNIFMYGQVCDSQNRIVQQLEDEFERWKAKKIVECGLDDKSYKTDKAKERYLMCNLEPEYVLYTGKIRSEQYKLSLIKRVVLSLESYAYKLHALKDYNMA